MERYLQYLLTDIEALIEQAPVPAENTWASGFADEPESQDIPFLSVKICDLIGLSADAFPPEKMLTDLQVIELVEAIDDLWSAWLLHWEMPFNLPVRNQYTALIREINGMPISYHPEDGGDVHICQYEEGKTCPFQPNDSKCNCREIEEITQHDIALWEEYVHSQGLDPYRDITKEEEELFDKEMRQRDLKKRYGDDWENHDELLGFMLEAEIDDEEKEEFLYALEIADELLGIILDTLSEGDNEGMKEDDDDDDLPF